MYIVHVNVVIQKYGLTCTNCTSSNCTCVILYIYQCFLIIGSVRIINLLGHYRDRLRNKGGEESHEEELDYLVSILESPFMKDFLQGKMSREDTAHFNEVTSQVISALEEEEEDRHLSPETQRKRLLRRRASLRALKLAVTPQSSPRITPKNSHGTLPFTTTASNESPLLQSVMATLSSRENSRETTPAESTTPPPSILGHGNSPSNNNNMNHLYVSPYTGKREWHTGNHDDETSDTPTSSRQGSHKDSTGSSQITVFRAGGEEEESNGPVLPSYNEVLNMRRRARSYEKLPLATPIDHTPLKLSSQQDNIVNVTLTKGERGLGFSVAKQRGNKSKEGQIIIRDIQPGGVAERDGRVQKGDQILTINGQNILHVSHPTVVALLQQAQGDVELTLLRNRELTTPTLLLTTPPMPSTVQARPHPFALPLPSVQKVCKSGAI